MNINGFELPPYVSSAIVGLMDTESVQALARELRVWQGLQHPNILQVIGFHLDKYHTIAWLVSPWEEEGNLSTYVRRTNPNETVRLQLVSPKQPLSIMC